MEESKTSGNTVPLFQKILDQKRLLPLDHNKKLALVRELRSSVDKTHTDHTQSRIDIAL